MCVSLLQCQCWVSVWLFQLPTCVSQGNHSEYQDISASLRVSKTQLLMQNTSSWISLQGLGYCVPDFADTVRIIKPRFLCSDSPLWCWLYSSSCSSSASSSLSSSSLFSSFQFPLPYFWQIVCAKNKNSNSVNRANLPPNHKFTLAVSADAGDATRSPGECSAVHSPCMM